MRWQGRRQSENVEDRRASGRRVGRPMLGGGMVIVLALVSLYLGADPVDVLTMISQTQQASVNAGAGSDPAYVPNPEDEKVKEFVSVILADTEDAWSEIFTQLGSRYEKPNLVLFANQVSSACGFANAAVGPFYCPGDNKLYLDMSFFDELSRMGASGDFAAAYVIAHEVGHHVQNQLDILPQVQNAQRKISREQANALQVRVELMADCLAGVWAHQAHSKRGMLETGDLEEGLQAATAVGDDTLQRRAGQVVQPDSFTHGSAEQRKSWFTKGFKSGSLEECQSIFVVP